MNKFFAPAQEFSLIEKMMGGDHFTRDGRGLGDDGFIFDPPSGSRWIVTTDANVEGVHYRLDWVNAEWALRKALLANLSDVNAMGGRSRHAFLILAAHKDWGEATFKALGRTIRELEAEFDVRVSGGDTVSVPGPSFFAFTVLGSVEGRPLLRSASAPGHRIYVSGTLGGSAGGLKLLENGTDPQTLEPSEHLLIGAHLDPEPPLELGPLLSTFEKSVAAIDVSDGLSSELWHLSRQSGCSLRVEWDKIPAHPALAAAVGDHLRVCVLNGGEDYQLLFTGNFSDEELARMRAVAAVTEIGEVEKGSGVFLTQDGKTSELAAGGFSHLGRK